MHVMGRVHDPDHGVVGVATFAGFFSPNQRGGTSQVFKRRKCFI
jgi:hypothetical protein